MTEWTTLADESLRRWEDIAEHWDDYMGEESNRWHRELIRPHTERLLDVREGQTVLDIACGNGNFSKRLAELGAKVVAFDYSVKMIERAKSRCRDHWERIEFHVLDATRSESLVSLGAERFDSAVANMALMDIADITPLVRSLHILLKKGGRFTFSIMHPCFQPPQVRKFCELEDQNGAVKLRKGVHISKYLTPEPYESLGIKKQPVPHLIFHRPLSYYLNLFFASHFVLDGIVEPTFEDSSSEDFKFDWHDIPPAVILRFRKEEA